MLSTSSSSSTEVSTSLIIILLLNKIAGKLQPQDKDIQLIQKPNPENSSNNKKTNNQQTKSKRDFLNPFFIYLISLVKYSGKNHYHNYQRNICCRCSNTSNIAINTIIIKITTRNTTQ